MSRTVAPALVALALLAGAARAAPLDIPDPDAPFGIPMGAAARRIPGATLFKPGWYAVDPPPKAEPGFRKVAVEAFPETGVCAVQGLGPSIAGDPDGAKTRAAIEQASQKFFDLYGQPERLDSCTSLLCTPEFWASDVQSGERHYGYRWSLHDKPVHGAREISIVATARGDGALSFILEYDSADLTHCRLAENSLPDS